MKSILPLHPSGGGAPPSGTGMSSFGPPLPSLLAAPPEDEVEVEPCSVPLDEELLLPELLEPAGTVVITGSVMSGNPWPGEFPHAPSTSARGSLSEPLQITAQVYPKSGAKASQVWDGRQRCADRAIAAMRSRTPWDSLTSQSFNRYPLRWYSKVTSS